MDEFPYFYEEVKWNWWGRPGITLQGAYERPIMAVVIFSFFVGCFLGAKVLQCGIDSGDFRTALFFAVVPPFCIISTGFWFFGILLFTIPYWVILKAIALFEGR